MDLHSLAGSLRHGMPCGGVPLHCGTESGIDVGAAFGDHTELQGAARVQDLYPGILFSHFLKVGLECFTGVRAAPGNPEHMRIRIALGPKRQSFTLLKEGVQFVTVAAGTGVRSSRGTEIARWAKPVGEPCRPLASKLARDRL